jgi:RHH-type proline utilization regulon transcriptional repressor/proline dehydrogenase/delta 1-pyrroline-5-carboxylate dehydrogenase
MAADPTDPSVPADEVVDEAVELVSTWLDRARSDETGSERALAARLTRMLNDEGGVEFTMRFIDRVARQRHTRLAARQLSDIVKDGGPPRFLSRTDRLLLGIGARLAPILPWVVVPLARRRMRGLVGHLVVDAEPDPMDRHFAAHRAQGYRLNVNLLGEAVLGEEEAARRRARTVELIDRDDIVYVSVKVSAIASQIDMWAFDDELVRIQDRLRELFAHSAESSPATFVNLDMEEYRDLELTVAAFTTVLAEPELGALDAGIVLQAYLPDSLGVLQRLVTWATDRHERFGGETKIRLVKGANLAMERVDAAMHGWYQAPYPTKAEVDANYKRCVDWALHPDRMTGVRIGIGSHNLFDVAWAHLLAKRRGLVERVEFEMLQGMAPALQRIVRGATGDLLLYTPVVRPDDFDVAIGYLFRRLDENTGPENFLTHVLTLESGSPEFVEQERRFRESVARRDEVATGSRRTTVPEAALGEFANQPDSDPTLDPTREWIRELRGRAWEPPSVPLVEDAAAIELIVAEVRAAQPDWWAIGASRRRRILRRAAGELERRRGDLLVAMAREGHKTFSEGDPEVSEAIDFARWYAQTGLELDQLDDVEFRPLGVIAVVPPWNFPVAIPAGGVLAALAAGNSVVLKPAPETPGCAELVADALWAAGVPRNVLRFVRMADGPVGRLLIESVDGVILTGSIETARMFSGWRPDLALLAETSGKNAMVISPNADLELAAADLVRSAFGHAGQKCSAASLGILVGPVYDDNRFRRQLVDAARSLRVGAAIDPGIAMGPLITPAQGKLARALQTLDPGESWLLEPRPLDADGALWSPGIRDGVSAGSFFHQTECFGPVLGLMRARHLDQAIEIQNGTRFGLTGGLHSLDAGEMDRWLDRVEVGNAYVNRVTTGAIVRRQPFGGWKDSSVGPASKAGGPDYLLSLGRWQPTRLIEESTLDEASVSDEHWWRERYGIGHDPSALFCESNVLRYRVRPNLAIRAAADAGTAELERVIRAAAKVGSRPWVSVADDGSIPDGRAVTLETDEQFLARMREVGCERVRVVGQIAPELRAGATEAGIDVIDAPVTLNGRLELRWFLREQSISRTLHRFGNIPRGSVGDAQGDRGADPRASTGKRR